jgi:hypothetical protein
MLTELLVVFVLGIIVGQVLKLVGPRPSLWAASAVAASALLFSLGLTIGLERESLLQFLPEVSLISLLLGVSAAVASAVMAYLLRGRKKV